MNKYSLAIHGGAGARPAGTDTPEKTQEYKEALKTALIAGQQILEQGGESLEAVERAVMELEDSYLFNAGKGSVYTTDGGHELDAAIMDGESREAGAVAQLNGIRNPIRLARDVMTKSEHVFLAAEGAMRFADSLGYDLMPPEYFEVPDRYQQWREARVKPFMPSYGTVGAVARDANGNIAAATSTGGIVNKRFGRVGDSPLIGAGTYANNHTCAVSCTGSGEFFIRAVVAYDVACLIEHRDMSLQQACDEVIHKRILEINGDGGLIAVDTRGNIAMPFNTERMYRGSVSSAGPMEVFV